MLGQATFERFGADPKIQVKLVSPRDRVPVHTHPDREFARNHFGIDCGKAEAWILVETTDDERAVAGVGFREHATEAAFRSAVEAQDTAAILDLLHTTPIKAGDVLFVEPGVPHFIGGGTFFVEIQEPADLGVLAEWRGFVDSPAAAAGGLDPALALTTFTVRPQTREAALGAAFQQPRVLRSEPGAFVEQALFSPGVESIFQARRLQVSTTFEPDDQRYYAAVVMAGAGWLKGDSWSQPIAAGDTFACAASLPHRYRAGAETLEVIRAFGPALD
jgi:mannose-6-phosphate isomerase